MKAILLFLLPVFCFGQGAGGKPVAYDTIKVLILLCDTSTHFIEHTDNNTIVRFCQTCELEYKKDTTYYQEHTMHWQNGYEVRKRHNVNDDSKGDYWCVGCPDEWRHQYYLDSNKKPLSKNIIAWQSIKQ